MATTNSPLRYPGGKSSITPFLRDVIELNGLRHGTYVEPYAGGAGAALTLLYEGVVDRIVINDFDPVIYAFWASALFEPDQFVERIETVPLTIEEWRIQKKILTNHTYHRPFDVGFAAFYLNRCNRSGILKAGPIGGKHQNGNYTLGVRFNRDALVAKIRRIESYQDQIDVFNWDAIQLLQEIVPEIEGPKLVYLDPPYYEKGQQLYLNAYEHEDHENLAWFLGTKLHGCSWVLTYDDADQIKAMYQDSHTETYSLNYFAHHAKRGNELLIAPPSLRLPEQVQIKYGLA